MEKRNLTRSLLKKGLLSLFAFLLVGSSLHAQTVPTSDALPQTISNASANVVLDFPVAAIDPGNIGPEITLDMTHTWSGDIVITLTDPNNNTVDLVSGVGGNTDLITGSSITFSPFSLNPNGNFSSVACVTGTCDIQPAGDFSTLDLIPGNWIVTISDTAGGDDGEVTAASMAFIPDPMVVKPTYVYDHPAFEASSPALPTAFDENTPVTVQFAVTGETNENSIQLDLDLSHTWVGDVSAVLVAPNGAGSIEVLGRNGGANDFIGGQDVVIVDCGADLTDAGVCAAGCELAATGGNMADFLAIVVAANGSVNGTWTLNFLDSAAGDGGSVNGAAITFGRIDCLPGGPLGVPTMSEWGLFLFFLVTLNLGLVFMHKMEAQKDLALAGGNASVSFTNNLPFEMNAFQAAMKHALGLAVVGFAFILVVWGTIVPMDLIGMAIAIPMVAYTLQMVKLLKK